MRALAEDYDQLNLKLFGGSLRRPALYLTDTQARLGQWESDPPSINLARHLLTEPPWPAVLEVLKHEMAHQFVFEVMTRAPVVSSGERALRTHTSSPRFLIFSRWLKAVIATKPKPQRPPRSG